ncbi:MAG: hypothetical protein RMJ53_08705 [Chitinophagales bacterium]|nr:hypothetical protein [Chitinophagales bacterium]
MEQKLTKEEVHLLHKKGKSFQQIADYFIASGFSEETVKSFINDIKKQYYQQQSMIGLPLLAIGILLCVVGFFINLIIGDCGLPFYLCLYGMAGTGSILLFVGLFLLLK